MKKSSKSLYGLPLWTIVYSLFSIINTGTLMAGMFQVPPQATVTGTITDIDGLSLPGVHIQVESTEALTISDLDGFFEIQSKANDVLVFSMVGFKVLSLTIRGRQHINVILERDGEHCNDQGGDCKSIDCTDQSRGSMRYPFYDLK